VMQRHGLCGLGLHFAATGAMAGRAMDVFGVVVLRRRRRLLGPARAS
jgi:hypothetical protein